MQADLLEYLQFDSNKPSLKPRSSREETAERCRGAVERWMDAFTLVNDVVTSIISVLHSFGLMDFRCRGLDLSTLCDKLSCFNAGSAHDRPLQRVIWEDQQQF